MLIRKLRSPQLGIVDLALCFIIMITSIFMRLWLVDYPPKSIFDEVHFGNFTNWYTQSQFFFDIHPPLAKLLMFTIANLSEYQGDLNFVYNFSEIYQHGAFVTLRITPSMFSGVCPALIYIAMRILDYSYLSALTASMIIFFDTSMLAEGKYILSDGILHFFVCFHVAILSKTFTIPQNDPSFIKWHVLTGLSLGCACSCKNTAMGLCVLDAYVYIVYFLFSKDYIRKIIIYGSSLALLAFIVYEVCFAIHFALLPFAGQGYFYMNDELQNQLLLNNELTYPMYIKRLSGSGLIIRALKLTKIMHSDNMKIVGTHVSMSKPSEWPFLTSRAVRFLIEGQNIILCHGNIFCYYLGIAGIALCLVCFKSQKFIVNMFWVVGWFFCYFPFFFVPRIMFLYHYLIPFMMSAAAYGAFIDTLSGRVKGFVCAVSLVFCLFGFWLWLPFVYGAYKRDLDIALWNSNWLNNTADNETKISS